MSARPGEVKAALLAHMEAGATPMTAARRVCESGLSSGSVASIYKYAALLRGVVRPRKVSKVKMAAAPAPAAAAAQAPALQAVARSGDAAPDGRAPGGRTVARDYNLPAPACARYRVEYVSGRGYFVADPEGRFVSGPWHGRDAAETRRHELQAVLDIAKRRGPRACLCCGRQFDSEGIHNRMCTPCRGRGDMLAAYGYAGAGDGRRPRKSSGA